MTAIALVPSYNPSRPRKPGTRLSYEESFVLRDFCRIDRAGKSILQSAKEASSNEDARSIKGRIDFLKSSCNELITSLNKVPLFGVKEVLDLYRDHKKSVVTTLRKKHLHFPVSFATAAIVKNTDSPIKQVGILTKEDLTNKLPYKIGIPRPISETELGKALLSRGLSPHDINKDPLFECRQKCKELLLEFSNLILGSASCQTISNQLVSLRFCIESVIDEALEFFSKGPPSENQLVEYLSRAVQVATEKQLALNPPDDTVTEKEKWLSQHQNALYSLARSVTTHSKFNKLVISPLAKFLLSSNFG